jgi:ubiquinone/menaquinone biosynthesis C-methylase UbiE
MRKQANISYSKTLYKFYLNEGLKKKSFGFGWKEKRDALFKFSEGEKVLDVGCAEGLYTRLLSTEKRHDCVVGVEVSKPKLLFAQNSVRDHKLDFVMASWNSLPFKNDVFNTVVWYDGIEHCTHPKKYLIAVGRVAKNRLILSVPTSTPLLLILELLQTKLNMFLLKTIGKVFRGHLNCFTHSKMKKFFVSSGFNIIHDSHNLPDLSILEKIKRLLYAIRETAIKIHKCATIFNSIFVITKSNDENCKAHDQTFLLATKLEKFRKMPQKSC